MDVCSIHTTLPLTNDDDFQRLVSVERVEGGHGAGKHDRAVERRANLGADEGH